MGEVEFERRRQDRRGPQRVGDVGRAFEVEPGKVRDVPERTAPTQHGERTNEGVRPGRKQGQPSCELAGNALDAVAGDPARGLVVRFDALRDHARHQRMQQQRVSAGRGVAGVAEAFGGRIEVAADKTAPPPRIPAATAGSARRWPASGPRRQVRGKAAGSPVLIATTTSTRNPSRRAPRWARNRSDAPSAHWQSSTMSSSGAREARFAVSQ